MCPYFCSFVQSLHVFPHFFCEAPSNFANRKVSQLDFLMLLAAEHLEVTPGGIKSSTWEVRFFGSSSFGVSMLERPRWNLLFGLFVNIVLQ